MTVQDEQVTTDPFPAHAGMNRTRASAPALRGTVPRTRGDEPFR